MGLSSFKRQVCASVFESCWSKGIHQCLAEKWFETHISTLFTKRPRQASRYWDFILRSFNIICCASWSLSHSFNPYKNNWNSWTMKHADSFGQLCWLTEVIQLCMYVFPAFGGLEHRFHANIDMDLKTNENSKMYIFFKMIIYNNKSHGQRPWKHIP